MTKKIERIDRHMNPSPDVPVSRKVTNPPCQVFDQIGGEQSFLALSNSQRINLLKEVLSSFTKKSKEEAINDELLTANNVGLLVIKPEAIEGKLIARKFLEEKYGIEILATKDYVYKLEGYLSIYLKTIAAYPDSFEDILAPLILHNTVNSSSAIVFRHANDYRLNYSKLFTSESESGLIKNVELGEPTLGFKSLVAGTGFEPRPHTLRRQLEPLIEDGGYYSFDVGTAASKIDIESRLQHRSQRNNKITFNGIHSPDSSQALSACFEAVFTQNEQQEILQRVTHKSTN